MKRTRLPKSGSSARHDRLRSAIRFELTTASEARLMDYVKAKKSLIAADPLLSAYNELAKKKKRTIIFQILSKFYNPLVIVLLMVIKKV
jgi:hypothetical protein